jgi:DNA-binding transcriptional LysR family regulator
MNLQHLKYAIEVSRTGSITQAARNLFIAQSNLSNAIKCLEEEIGITIFKRTKRGTVATPEGVRFLNLARPIVYQTNALETEYTRPNSYPVQINVSSVRSATFTAYALSQVINELPEGQRASIRLNEAGAMEVIEDVFSGRYAFGVVKFFSPFAAYYTEVIAAKGLAHESLFESTVRVLMSESHPLADRDILEPKELIPYIETGIGENESQLIPYSVQRDKAGVFEGDKVLYTYDRAALFHLLSECRGAFMWISRVHPDLLQKYNLILKDCAVSIKEQEVLVYPSEKPESAIIKAIINRIKAVVAETE